MGGLSGGRVAGAGAGGAGARQAAAGGGGEGDAEHGGGGGWSNGDGPAPDQAPRRDGEAPKTEAEWGDQDTARPDIALPLARRLWTKTQSDRALLSSEELIFSSSFSLSRFPRIHPVLLPAHEMPLTTSFGGALWAILLGCVGLEREAFSNVMEYLVIFNFTILQVILFNMKQQ